MDKVRLELNDCSSVKVSSCAEAKSSSAKRRSIKLKLGASIVREADDFQQMVETVA